MRKRTVDAIADYLPLKTAWLHILLALADGARHGYAIRAAVEERTAGRIKLWPATLYGSMRDLAQEGLIMAPGTEPGPEDDARRRYYELTVLGKDVLTAEVRRLEELVVLARGTRALANT